MTKAEEMVVRRVHSEADGLAKALALLGRLDLGAAINRDIAAPLAAILQREQS